MPHPAPDNSIAQRVEQFFRRQIEWYSRTIDELEGVQQGLSEDRMEALEAQRDLYDQDIAAQARQLEALLAEWKNSPEPQGEQLDLIRELARQAEHLAAQTAAQLERAAQTAGAGAQHVRADLLNLSNGRRIFGGYRQNIVGDTGLFDEQV